MIENVLFDAKVSQIIFVLGIFTGLMFGLILGLYKDTITKICRGQKE